MKKKSLRMYTLVGLVGVCLVVGLFWLKRVDRKLLAEQAAEPNVTVEAGEGQAPESVKIGVLQLLDHDALNAIYDGMVEELADAGYVEGENLTISFHNGQGDQATLGTMAEQLVSERDVDLYVGIATPSAQLLAGLEHERPVILAGVTYPEVAELVKSEERPGANVTGASDRVDVAAQLALIREVLPESQKLGILYTAGDDTASRQAEDAEQLADAEGWTVDKRSIAETNDLQQVAEQMARQVDAIYVPIDNAIASAMPTLVQATDPHGVPVFPSADTMVAGGGLMGLGVDQFNVGRVTGEVILDVLGGADPAEYAVRTVEDTEVYLNEAVVKKLGVTVPPEVLERALKVTEGGGE